MSVLAEIKRRLPRPWVLPASYLNQKIRGNLEPELRLLPSLVRKGSCAVDVGANVGFYSYALSRLCSSVEAFEPLSQCAEVLEAYGAPNVRVHRMGLSSVDGSLALRVPRVAGVSHVLSASFSREHAGEQDVHLLPVRRLDGFEFRDVSFVKIDVEGHELEVLEGSRETILREKPVLLIEVEQRHHAGPIFDVFRRIFGLGPYVGSFLWQGTLRPLQEFRYETHQMPFLGEVVRKGYVNNFIFRPLAP
ncbi:MAG: FkbM family methyltransferase [Deltaproteobacteria bacterium]|nr:FkbM family methyltransferase [Deltaproteobacteria bacterium]